MRNSCPGLIFAQRYHKFDFCVEEKSQIEKSAHEHVEVLEVYNYSFSLHHKSPHLCILLEPAVDRRGVQSQFSTGLGRLNKSTTKAQK